MAARLDRALGNVVYRVKSLSPTSTLARGRFELYDPTTTDCPLSTAGLRKFFVEWLTADDDEAATDIEAREALQTARLHVEYPTVLGYMKTQILIARDRHDIRKALRDCDNWDTGWTDENGNDQTTDETGVFNRWFDGDEINRSQRDKWRYTAQLKFWLREGES